MRLFILSILMGFPLLEGAVLYKLGQSHGGLLIAWLIFAAIAGAILIKEARFVMVARLAEALAQGRFSLAAVIDSFRTDVAGLLLIFPGVISDVIALVLLLIPIREPAFEKATFNRRETRIRRDGAIEGEFRREN
jgi:UPF0716 protein FxsA